jgi:hypothetical protein
MTSERSHEEEFMTNVVTSEPIAGREQMAAVKVRQQAVWASGDFAVIGTTLQIVGELLCEGVDVRGGERVLDVAAGHHGPFAQTFQGNGPVGDVVPREEDGRTQEADDRGDCRGSFATSMLGRQNHPWMPKSCPGTGESAAPVSLVIY